jgi:hypothetical protein
MSKPVTPLVGCDVFATDQIQRVLLVRRADNDRSALPSACQQLGETRCRRISSNLHAGDEIGLWAILE